MNVMRIIPAIFIIFLLIATAACNGNIPGKNKETLADTFSVKKDTIAPVNGTITDSLYKIYLTFDDGPAEGSENINRIAATDSARINVFIIGEKVFGEDSVKHFFQSYQSNPFIETGNHSFTHASKHYRLYYRNPDGVVRDIELNADTLHLKNKIVRLPGRNTWRINGRKRSDLPDDKKAADSLAAKGYSVFGWDVEWPYFPDSSHRVQSANTMMRIVENLIDGKRTFTPGNVVILCHDPMFIDANNVLQLDLFIRKIKQKKGYKLEHLSNYP
ncbi:MAG: polysaccharide deacetylase family protein [Bacteroidota bacterium]|nr:polysaccharide deacetylase family protein [Bacteroidota bacterium]